MCSIWQIVAFSEQLELVSLFHKCQPAGPLLVNAHRTTYGIIGSSRDKHHPNQQTKLNHLYNVLTFGFGVVLSNSVVAS